MTTAQEFPSWVRKAGSRSGFTQFGKRQTTPMSQSVKTLKHFSLTGILVALAAFGPVFTGKTEIGLRHEWMKSSLRFAGAACHAMAGATKDGTTMPTTATASCAWQRWAKRVRRKVGAFRGVGVVVVPAPHGAAAMGERAVGDGRRITGDTGHWTEPR